MHGFASVEEIAREIVAREGGWSDDRDDPGGATNHGVTLATLRRLGLDVDGDGDADRQDLRQLSSAQAAEIFLEHYYRRPGIDRLPRPLQPPVFDMQVNAGAQAVRLLQDVLLEFGEPVSIDGVLGPQTWGAAHRVWARAGRYLVDAYGIARRDYYYDLADAHPAMRKYARRRDGGKGGWILRAEAYLSPRYRLSEQEHAARVAGWD